MTSNSDSTCPFCNAPSHAKACPELRELLFAPFTDVCVSCGDQLHYDAPLNSMCAACQEYHSVPTGEYRTEIVYDRASGDYAMILDGETVGMARTMHEADVTLTQLILKLKHGQYFVEAA